MEGSAASPEMVNYADLLKLDVVSPVLVALEELERLSAGFQKLFPDNKNRPKAQRRGLGTPASFAILPKLQTNSALR